MKIILTCGHPFAGFEWAHTVLANAGLEQWQPAEQQSATPMELRVGIFAAMGIAQDCLERTIQLKPDDEWGNRAKQMLSSKHNPANCGWADAGSVWLLDFWKSMSPAIRFMLVYSAPEFAVGQMLRDGRASLENVGYAVSTWIDCNSEMLRFYYRNPDLCILVNATAILHAPSPFVRRVADSFGMTLVLPAADLPIKHVGALLVACSLAKAMIEDRDDARSLYREMESSADVNASDTALQDSVKHLAWHEYSDLLNRMSADPQTSGIHKIGVSPRPTETSELSEENELLMVQLHQTQEEMEHYFLQSQELARKEKEQADQLSAHFVLWRNSQPAEVTYDLRHEFEGKNWYPAEADGCWAGPGEISSIKVLPLGIGQYELQLDVMDAMEPEILQDMKVSLNGAPLTLGKDCKAYPAIVVAQFSTEAIANGAAWEFTFMFPRSVSPSRHGSDDLRSLAIRLRTLRLRKI